MSTQTRNIILLSGTPASGKDTVTARIAQSNPKFKFFKKHSCGHTDIKEHYIQTSAKNFMEMADNGEFLQYHFRYGRGYGVCLSNLEKHWENNETPIIHAGRYKNIIDLKKSDANIINILLLTSIDKTRERLAIRHHGAPEEIESRVSAYYEERDDLVNILKSGGDFNFDFVIDTSRLTEEEVATRLLKVMGLTGVL